ncbi:MAG: ABC transporter ATP-binding protein, partial [Pseudomonadota bacterium]|nr:ABC transporter ATP-binding protein [Pseudomonadota bacterium]
ANKKDDRRNAAEARKKLQPLRNTVKKAEHKMDALQTKLNDIELQLADNSLYESTEKEKLKALIVQQGSLKTELETVEMDWLAASEELELAGQE